MTADHASLGRLWALMLTVFVDMVGFLMILPLLPFYATRLGASPFLVGLMISAFAVAQLATPPVWGRLSDRHGRRPMLMLGVSIMHVVGHPDASQSALPLSANQHIPPVTQQQPTDPSGDLRPSWKAAVVFSHLGMVGRTRPRVPRQELAFYNFRRYGLRRAELGPLIANDAFQVYLANLDRLEAPARVPAASLSESAAAQGWHYWLLPPGLYHLLVLPPGGEQNPPAVAFHAPSGRFGRLTEYKFESGRGAFWSPELMAYVFAGAAEPQS